MVAGCKGTSGGGKPEATRTVAVMTVRTEPVALSTELAGRTRASEESDVRPQVGGILRKRLFAEGSEVRAGQPLFQIDPAVFAAAERQARADLAKAEATLKTARLRAQRFAALGAEQLAARQDIDDAAAAAGEAAATRDAALAALQTAQTNLGFAEVTAPIDGRIGRSTVTPGALVTANQEAALARIQRLDPMFVDVTQSSSEYLALRRAIASGGVTAASTEVRLKLPDGTDYPLPGTLAFADLDVAEQTGTVTLRATVPNPDRQLLPGMYVRAIVGQGVRQQGILVPQSAVDRTPRGGAQAWVVGADGTAQARALTVRRTVGNRWLVDDGLKPGERVIVEGTQGLSDGTAVTVRASAPQPPRPAAAAAAKG